MSPVDISLEDITTLVEVVAVPLGDITTPGQVVAIPFKDIIMPRRVVGISLGDITTPVEVIVVLLEDITTQYLTLTRPNISFAVNRSTSICAHPNYSSLECCETNSEIFEVYFQYGTQRT